MTEKLLFLTGHLAHASLCREIEALSKKPFEYEVVDLGVNVAALMTDRIIRRRLTDLKGADRVIVPGLCAGDLDALGDELGKPVERGPKDLKDLPEHFGQQGRAADLDSYDVQLFAEIVDAPERSLDEILARAEHYRSGGANVIDLGCLPGKPFPHLEDAVRLLHDHGHLVSVDSMEIEELRRGGQAGADFLLSLKTDTLWLLDEVASVPILIPSEPGNLGSLYEAMEAVDRTGRRYIADSILDPVHFGFTDSIVRYHRLRADHPDVEIMVGTGNVTELTDADTTGISAVLFGIISELGVNAVLTTEVSPHARTAVREADLARRMMFAARRDRNLPRRYHPGLMALRDRKPFPYTEREIRETADAVRDPNFRIQNGEQGTFVYNRDGVHVARDPFDHYANIELEGDAGHAFYLGVELARAQVAWQLGKRYRQDSELEWGITVDSKPDELAGHRDEGPTRKRKK